jgi:hypothetical protein
VIQQIVSPIIVGTAIRASTATHCRLHQAFEARGDSVVTGRRGCRPTVGSFRSDRFQLFGKIAFGRVAIAHYGPRDVHDGRWSSPISSSNPSSTLRLFTFTTQLRAESPAPPWCPPPSCKSPHRLPLRLSPPYRHLIRDVGLRDVITDGAANKDARIDSDLHSSPAQPDAAASLISSRVAIFLVLPASTPRKPSIVPFARAARSRSSPPDIFSKSTRSPGLIPRCCSKSRFSVICPFAVTACEAASTQVVCDAAVRKVAYGTPVFAVNSIT